MEIIPAIDLRNGKCVRLYQGDYSRETIFSEDPAAMALRWQGAGAKRLHLVDLDGAAAGELRNAPVIEEIAHRVQIPVQVGGGIRQIETINHLLDSGVSRAILGTAAIEDPGLVEEACRKFGERIIVSIDAREGFVRGHGWKEGGKLTVNEVIHEMLQRGVKRFIYTDIARDGTLSGPDFEEIAKVIARARVPVIAAGGIASVEHLKRLAELGAEGAIVGRAIYTGDINLEEALTLTYLGSSPTPRSGSGTSPTT
ncbi:MAG: 1-(5-phosphoribosyl)-5-((5-phosphoribosylamino)methylideneamino) imidazole-4-carboxamide isomerase [Dehalococcoidia bacterium]|nr:1-(5-phosphoribosyl)-5-((5-phosphoribosylamino)methylideneamino) imidazole-4-carboxamide isomerase [Chloroflexota bacterium]MBT9159364.1 1-(5-phosphoribosyl)-5-((5-phosphoribosylamino)methylideneamino) imidazole-4-carboxamide isomerase [Chloroflexota bacterium]MBT9162686.1 1-(5-phosphoribosyl)-5-((5-phosphoribosylamino)methylideneamino) imidazole-4-carboxamide isomerase [Chloroflexota bacterium]